MRVMELFAGAGGAALGLERAGFSHAALCEWDRDACATLRAAGLGPVVEGDVRDLSAIEAVAGRVDAVWSSFPCQAWSTAGRRGGAMDARNGWPWTLAAIDRLRPTWFMGENVRGLLLHTSDCQHKGGQLGLFSAARPDECPGCYFETVLIPSLRARFYHVGWWILDAADYGVPQRRRRVFLLAGPSHVEPPTPTHGEGRAPWVSMGEALGIEGEVQAGVCDRDSGSRGAPRSTIEAAPTVSAASRLYLGRPSPCVSAAGECKGSGAGGHPERPQRASDALYLATGRRRLTVEECAILQGFPAGYPFQGGVESRYRQVGNAVPPRLAEVVGRAVLSATK